MATAVDSIGDAPQEAAPVKVKSVPKTLNIADGVDVKLLLEAGAHFGHKTSRWHPKMAPFIHSKRAGNHIIDLTKTATALQEALNFVTDTTAHGSQILLVGTKRQAKDIIRKLAADTNMPYVTERWLGGVLTNQKTIGGRIKYLKDQEAKMENGTLASKYNKLELQRYQEEIDRLNYTYGGVKNMAARPGAMFIVDLVHENNALREAKKLNIKTIAIVDSNADPSLVDYPIPANDDAIKTIQLICDYIKLAIEQGKSKQKPSDKANKQTEKSTQ